MNRLEQTFQKLNQTNRKAFVPYIMAGDGGIECLIDRMLTLEEMGATAIEIGIPFSDPVADGPTIQRAGIRALANGTNLRITISVLKKAKDLVSIPIILMTYINPIYSYGIEQFIIDIKEAGVSGCIIPDLPIEEEDIIAPILKKENIELIRLVTMTTPRERIEVIANKGQGFLYTVTVKGITGSRQGFDKELEHFLKMVKEISPIPVLAGFGISNEEQVKQIAGLCDGVIVGSKIIDLFEHGDLETMEKLISVLQE